MTHTSPAREPVVTRDLSHPGRRPATKAIALGLALLVIAAPALGAILLTSSAADLVQSMADQPALVTGAAFVTIPPGGQPHGIGDAPLAGFPLSGGTYAIMTTGNAVHADEPNTAPNTSGSDGGPSVRGDTDHDVSVLKIDLNVPDDANCLSINFRFLSEEYPEFVGSFFNDAFIAELDSSTWTTSGTAIIAPDNFAFDPAHNVISVNAVGPTNMTGPNAVGTTYDGATPLLSASTPITPGPHSLFLSIFDQGDDIFDSAVFLDRLVISRIPPEGCVRGATVLSAAKITSTPVVAPGGTAVYTITISNSGDLAETLTAISDTLPAGFSYVTGSSSVLTTADPAVSGQNLSWSGPFVLPAHGSGVLTFSATASTTPGDYLNNAGATAALPVTPTGPTAKVTVSPCASSPDGTPCSDDNACTGPDACSGGLCVGGPSLCACQSNTDCNDNNPCTDDTCENPGTATAACAHVNNTAPCSDGNACTRDDACQGGVCTGSNPVVCTASDRCHVAGTCNPSTGACSNPPAQDGAACDDADVCTTNDTCQAGTCKGGAHNDADPACNPNQPPTCTVALPTSIELWPPNHKFVNVSIGGVTDPDGDSVTTKITGISQDEPLLDRGDGNTCPDGKGVGTGVASVRAERSGTGDGRVYRVSFTSSDGKGGQCTGIVRVCVPHDQRPGHVCGDDGPVIDSTGPCTSQGNEPPRGHRQ